MPTPPPALPKKGSIVFSKKLSIKYFKEKEILANYSNERYYRIVSSLKGEQVKIEQVEQLDRNWARTFLSLL